MNLEKIFKNLIILELIYLVLSLAVTVYVEWDLPIEEGELPLRLVDIFSLIVLIAYYVNLYFSLPKIQKNEQCVP